MEWVTAAVIGLSIAMFLRIFIVEGFEISGDSMLPTFQNSDFVFAEKITQKMERLEIEDIVIVETNRGEEKKIIKRVVGLAGDKISVEDGYLFRNGEKVAESYILEASYEDFEEMIVPEGHIFVLGDNRNNSSDSRYFGTFSYEQVKGRVAVELFNNPLKFY